MFDQIVNWKLLEGSHEFPGPDGGTCINEAAIVAAGFEYKTVNSPSDCPPCFSRVIAQYAIMLNDNMPDDLRQELLLPFVVRLSGTADDRKIEIERCCYMATQTVKRILPIVLKERGLHKEADMCASVTDVYLAIDAAGIAKRSAEDADSAYAADVAATAAYAADVAAYAATAAYAADAADAATAAYHSADVATAADAKKKIWITATDILDEAIKLGRHTIIETPIAIERLEKIKREKVVA